MGVSTRTENKAKMKRALKLAARTGEPPYPDDVDRPVRRSDCAEMPRPCPFVSCAEHAYFQVKASGNLTFNHPRVAPENMQHSCLSDVISEAEKNGGMTLAEIGSVLGLTRERVRQIEARAQAKLRDQGIRLGDIYSAP